MEKETYELPYTGQKFFNRFIMATIGFFSGGIFFGAAVVMIFFTKHLALGTALAALELIGIFVFVRASKASESWLSGLVGETKVTIILDQMWQDGVRAVHDLNFSGNGNVDHVAVTPAGVWAIESKFIDGAIEYKEGQLTRNGVPFKKNFLKQTFAEARAVEKYLAANGRIVTVKPVLAFSDKFAKVRFGKNTVENVYVIGPLGFRYLILDSSLPSALDSRQIDHIVDLLEASRHK